MQHTALVVGATGLVGKNCVELLLQNPQYSTVKVALRKKLDLQHPKLQQYIVDFNHLNNYTETLQATHVYCCLGTTLKQAQSAEAFQRVDFEYVKNIAQICKVQGTHTFLLVSSIGANAKSRLLYPRTKGEIEQALQALNFEQLHIFRPSVLQGTRPQTRTGEILGMLLLKGIQPFLIYGLKKYKPIPAQNVAKAMIYKALNPEPQPKNQIYESDTIAELSQLYV